MATLNNIFKAVETLKGFQQNPTYDCTVRKKEKISNCVALADGICSSTIKVAPKFSHVLSVSIELLLTLCDDSESDVRMVAEESLNRIIRAMADGNIVKVQVELYREIRRNGSARSLRSALWRFAQLAHMIRPMKGKAYVSNLIPCIVATARRSEESVIETLAHSLPLILKTLGPFMTDNDVKTVLKAFFQNISLAQAVFRRTAASMILTTCLNCRKPQVFFYYVLHYLIDTVVPVTDEEDRLTTVIGVFGCLRIILPYINEPPSASESNSVNRIDSLIQIYELCLHYAKWHSDHNVVNAALETLVQLVQSPPSDLASILLCQEGITRSRIVLNENAARLSLGQMSISTTIASEGNSDSTLNLFEPDIPEIAPKVEKWIVDSENALPIIQRPQIRQNEIVEAKGKTLENYSSLTIGSIDSEDVEEGSDVGSEIEKSEKLSGPSIFSQRSKEEEYSDDVALSIASPHRMMFDIPFQKIDIGTFTDADVPLKYCCRYLVSSFLLTGSPGQLIPDKMFRVSVKSLTLTCIGHILRLYPNLFLFTVAKLPIVNENQQMITDILLFANHPDPQIRGNVSTVIGSFLKAIFVQFGGAFESMDLWTEAKCSSSWEGGGTVFLQNLINLLLEGLKDESATTCRKTLMALSTCLTDLLESVNSKHGIPILTVLPRLVKNPYFLVKIKLTEVLSELPYTTIEYITSGSQFQENVIAVMMKLLGDQDQRVRHSASNAIVKIIPSLYYPHPNEDAITRKASQYTERYLSAIISNPLETSDCHIGHKLLIDSLVEPFKSLYVQNVIYCYEKKDNALSRIVSLLTEKLVIDSSKYLTYGCCEALSGLSEIYFTTIYPRAWDCLVPKTSAKKTYRRTNSRGDINEIGLMNDSVGSINIGLMQLTISLLSSSPISLDLSTHRHLILLAGNLVSGMALCNLKISEPINKNDADSVKLWGLFKDKQMYQHLELLLTHVIRVLNIFVHVIDEVQLIQPSVKSALPSLPSAQSLSPKRKPILEQKSKDKEDKMTTLKFGKEEMGTFSNIPYYLKLYDILKAAHSNYKVTLDSEASEMYLSLLNATLEVLSQILEVATFNEAGRIAEEILHYLQTTVILSPTSTVQCVQQLLKCLFGTNLSAQWSEFDAQRNADRTNIFRDESAGFYNQCFQKPARQLAETIKAIGNNCRDGNEPDTRWIGLLHRKDRKLASIFNTLTRSSDQKASVTSFIRLFEPMVIKSLKQYTVTSSVLLQCQVLMLLTQLVQLRVNYCLLDSDKIFIDFVIKQFEFIEAGQIQQAENLLPKIFNFLVHLSYEKYHTKIIIGVPKIIQLCDGLMASGQLPLTHCIPALAPVVEIFF